MTLIEVGRIFKYWKKKPPVHVLVGAYFGVGKGEPNTEEIPANFELASAKVADLFQGDQGRFFSLPPQLEPVKSVNPNIPGGK